METDWQELPSYEGFKRRIHPVNHVMFTHEVMFWREELPDAIYKVSGTDYDDAEWRSRLMIEDERARFGS